MHGRSRIARSQLLDNLLWTCASGITVWTACEVGFMWMYANDLVPFYLDPAARPACRPLRLPA